MSDAVYLARDGQQQGPYTREQLTAMAQRGEIADSDLGWYEGLLGWRDAGTVLHGLGIALGPVTPPPLPDSVPAPAAITMNRRQEYEAFIGPEKSDYYVPVFEHFDAGRGAAWWNWPAGLITQYWMLYRGMLLWGFLWYPILSYVVAFVLIRGAAALLGPLGTALGYPGFLIGSIVVMGLYGNKIFHGHVLKQIRRSTALGLSEAQRRNWLIRRGASGYLWVLIVILVAVAVLGMLAAIAIPAYQDYSYRVQVGLDLEQAGPIKTRIAEYYLMHGTLPENNLAAGLAEPLPGRFAQQVEVVNGTIRFSYAGPNARLDGKVLAVVPQVTRTMIFWHCDTAETTMPDQWLPKECRKQR
jgi:type II secretory pathway pseudopilin PulG